MAVDTLRRFLTLSARLVLLSTADCLSSGSSISLDNKGGVSTESSTGCSKGFRFDGDGEGVRGGRNVVGREL